MLSALIENIVKSEDKNCLEIISVNVRGLHGPKLIDKVKAINEHFKTKDPVIVSFLDTHLNENSQKNIEAIWQGKSFFANNCYSHYTSGISIHIANIDLKNIRITKDQHGRYILLNFDHNNKHYLIAFIYAPSGHTSARKIFFQNLDKILSEQCKGKGTVILAGDFNCVEEPMLDKVSKTSKDTSINILNTITSNLDLIDVWRIVNPNKIEYTCFSSNGYHSRLDRFYVQSEILNTISKIEHKSFPFSDHSSIHLHLEITIQKQGPNTWCLNQKLLSNPNYISKIKNFWNNWQKSKTNFNNLNNWWDKGKDSIKKLSINFSRKEAKLKNKIKKSLYKRLRNAENQGKIQTINEIKSKLASLQRSEAKEHFLAKRIQWINEGEDFDTLLPLLKQNLKSNHNVTKITDQNGNEYNKPKEILTQFEDFYKKLYTKTNTNQKLQDEFLSGLQSSLSEETSDLTERAYTKKEFKEALFQLPSSKSPGSDGLPTEFYKTFWDTLSEDYLQVYKNSLSNKTLPKSQREAIIKCIPKKGDLTKVANWRPISLLNTDYKILSRAIANRLLKLLPNLISEEQTCSVKGRKISQNLLINRDFIEYANKNNLKASLISLDQMKAFDRVEWPFLIKTLQKMNFGNNFISHIELLYNSIYSRVKVNGFLTTSFLMGRGLRQGCPLSAILYVIVGEVLNMAINNDPLIKGVAIEGIEIKLSQYADDNCCFLIGDKSIYALFDLLKNFEKATGSKINISKTQALWLGENIGRTDKPLNLNWKITPITILGLPFGNEDLTNTVWQETLSNIRRTLKLWKRCNISLKSKISVIRTLLIPQIIYPTSVYPMKEKHMNEIKKIFEDFLWSSKRPKIRTNVLYLPIKLGGLGLPNLSKFQNALLLTWVKDIFQTCSTQWKMFFLYFTNLYRKTFLYQNIFKIRLANRTITMSKLPEFYKVLLKAWKSFTGNKRPPLTEPQQILIEPLILNPFMNNIEPPKWYINSDHAVTTVDHLLLNENKSKFLTREKLNQMYNLNLDKRTYNNLKNSIPLAWKVLLNNLEHQEPPSTLLNVWKIENNNKINTSLSNMNCKLFYNEQCNHTFEAAAKDQASFKTPFYDKWTEKTGPVTWTKVFTFLNKRDICRNTVDVQYRLLHFGILTRLKLFNMKIQPSPICTRCLLQNEDIEHLFISCQNTIRIWQYAMLYMKNVYPQINAQNIYKAIIIGFSDNENYKQKLSILEDIRLAFFQAVWLQRNKALWNFEMLNGPLIFRGFLNQILNTRLQRLHDKNKNSLLKDYAKIAQYNGKQLKLKIL